MSTTTDTATLDITNLYFPQSAGPREALWHEMQNDEDIYDREAGGPTYTYAEAFNFEHDAETFPMIARDGDTVGVIVDGTVYTRDEIDTQIEDAQADEDETCERIWQSQLDALDAVQDESSPSYWGADGPMMNYFYPVSDYTPGTLEDWAAKIADLPLCAVEIDGERGLALTGGGMDLSWEIAEAFIRLGYYPPTWIDLPGTAGRGTSADDRAIATALAKHYTVEAQRLQRKADELARYDDSPIED